MEKQSGKWESDQQIKTYDGVTWEMLMWHSSHKLTKVCGALDDPPQGKQIKKYIRSLIENGRSLIYPQLFE